MLLDRIDIDAHGPLHRVELGPFAEHLNVVCGPVGSGKTAIARFIRDSLVDRQYPLGMMSSSTGTVVWADRHGMVHCRREKDGTPDGRTVVDFHPRGDHNVDYGPLRQSWISDISDSSEAARSLRAIEMPESLVDGVITDTAVTNVARVVAACVANGLDAVETYHGLPLSDETVGFDRESIQWQASGLPAVQGDVRRGLRSQLADVEAELARLDSMSLNYQSLIERRSELTSRLAAADDAGHLSHDHRWTNSYRDQQRLGELCEMARKLRLRQGELRRDIAELDRTASTHRFRHSSYRHSSYSAASRRYDSDRRGLHALDDSVQRQLDDLDAQVIGWRRTLLEVRGLREAFESGRESLGIPLTHTWEDAAIRRRRLNGFLNSVDRYERTWDTHPPGRRKDDICERVDSATRQIDWLLDRYSSGDSVSRNWYDTLPASASYRATTTLGDTLRAIRNDLRHVQQNASVALAESPSRSDFGNLEELRQCEQWLVAAIDQLTSHRESIIRGFGPEVGAAYVSNPHYVSNPQHVGNPQHVSNPDYVANPEYATHPDHARSLDDARLRAQRTAQLDDVTAELDTCLAEAAAIRRALRGGAERDEHHSSGRWIDRDAMQAELSRIDEQLASYSRVQWLQERRRALMAQLGTVRHPDSTRSPLAEAASRWLVRLTGGRLRRIHWTSERLSGNGEFAAKHSGVSIDGHAEADCSEVDRAITVMAVRMAAGDLLAATGRQVPLVFETHRGLLLDKIVETNGRYDSTLPPFHQRGYDGRANQPLLAAIRDYTRGGRQAIVLTSDQTLTAQAARVGARVFQVHAQHVVHPHRPIWRPQYEAERYVGPHPHTYGNVDAADYVPVPHASQPRPVVDINRDFDMAWREAYGFFDTPEQPATGQPMMGQPVHPQPIHPQPIHPQPVHPQPVNGQPARTDWRAPGADYRDGYYYSDSYTTVTPQTASQFDDRGNWVSGQIETATSPRDTTGGATKTRHGSVDESPFFLTVDSPIDQAPSIDAVAAARLRGLSVTHITHLMQQDSNRLSDALGLANVNAATIRRWKAECRLVCRVPQLRGFDARVLVGCGVTDPAQLAAIHPVDLLQEVEAFLATQRGQQILSSGSSHELSRITSWIAAANSSPEERAAAKERNRVDGLGGSTFDRALYDLDSDRYDDGATDGSRERGRVRRRRGSRSGARQQRVRASDGLGPVSTRSRSDNDGTGLGYGRGNRNGSRSRQVGSRSGTGRAGGATRSRSRRNSASALDGSNSSRSTSRSSRDGEPRTTRRRRRRASTSRSSNRDLLQYSRDSSDRQHDEQPAAREDRAVREAPQPQATSRRDERTQTRELRFYLQRNSPIVDAPSIGTRLSERLNAIGIETVNDLLAADPETLAAELANRRVDADVVVQWQQQAEMICRVPMLRGHDAQLLVMAEVTTPEELSASDPEELFTLIDPISRSKEGQRVLRGGKLPDLEEVTEWVEFAQHTRELIAA